MSDYINADLTGADFKNKTLTSADYINADLTGADFTGATLDHAKFYGADLIGAVMMDTNMRKADLRGANLRMAKCNRAVMRRADLRGADLRGADLMAADLSGADLREADLRGAYLCVADLRGANLLGAKLDGANFDGATIDKETLVYDEGMEAFVGELGSGTMFRHRFIGYWGFGIRPEEGQCPLTKWFILLDDERGNIESVEDARTAGIQVLTLGPLEIKKAWDYAVERYGIEAAREPFGNTDLLDTAVQAALLGKIVYG